MKKFRFRLPVKVDSKLTGQEKEKNMMEDALNELRKIEQADTRRYKAYRRKLRPILRGVADGRGRVTTNLHHLAENAGLGCDDARFALGDMERRGEIEVVIFPDYYGDGLIRLHAQAPAAKGRESV